MKKKYFFKPVLTLLFTIFIFSQTYAQVRIVQVDPATEAVTIHNYGGTTINISNYWLCSLLSYGELNGMTIIDGGSMMLASGADVTVTSSVALNNTAADLGLYNTNSFGSASAMEDFLQWGSAGNGRESVANTAGLWTTGDFIMLAPPYQYNGDGFQNGVTNWDTVLGIKDFENNLKFTISPNPTTSILTLKLSANLIDGNIKIFDILGKQVITKEIYSNNLVQINVSSLSKGMYLVKVSSEKNTQTKRFIKE